MRDVIFMIDNELDFKKFVLSMESKVPAQSKPAEIRYERHPVSDRQHRMLHYNQKMLTCL